MSHSDYKTVLRLPSTLEEYLKSLCKDYGLSINEAVKHCIIEHKRRTDLLLGSTTSSTTPTVQSLKSSTTHSTIESSQGAPYILYILKNNKYSLIISDPRLSEAWDDWCNYRKSKKKTIKDSQLKQTFRDFETIFEAEGIDGIIDRLNGAISAGYIGWYFGKETLKAKPVTVTNGNFTEDDF